MRQRSRISPIVALVLALMPISALADNPPTSCLGTNDADFDGVPDECDRCPGFDDTINADNDELPDACDRCPYWAGDSSNGPDDPNRPSLLFQESELAALRARLQGAAPGTALAALYQNLLARADDLLTLSPATPQQFNGAVTTPYEDDMKVLAFAYLMNEGSDPDEYLCKALEYIDVVVRYGQWNVGDQCTATRHALARGLALTYDWLYDELSDDTRTLIVDKLEDEIGNTPDATPGCGANSRSDGSYYQFQNPGDYVWWENRPWQNHQTSALSALATSGYALLPDLGQDAQDWIDLAAEKMDLINDNMDLNFDAQIRSPDGGTAEGLFYGRLWHEWSALYYMLREDQDGIAYSDDENRVNAVQFLIHNGLPDRRNVFSFGDFSGSNPERSYLDGQITMLANAVREFGDGYAHQRLEELVTAPGILAPYLADPIPLLALDETVQTASLSNLPTAAYFDDVGVATMRNRWENSGDGAACNLTGPAPTDQFVAFKSGWPSGIRAAENADVDQERGFNNGHAHSDQNSLIYADGADLFLHDYPVKICAPPGPGCVGCDTVEAGARCTRWHNTVTFEDEAAEWGQVWTRCLEFDNSVTGGNGGIGAGNLCQELIDPAQRTPPLVPFDRWQAFLGQFDAGEQFRTDFSNPVYKWVSASAKFVYDPFADITRFDRDVVFTDRYVVVFDRIDGQKDVNWYFHSPADVNWPPQVTNPLEIVYEAPSGNRMTQTVLWPTGLSYDCRVLTNDPFLDTEPVRQDCELGPPATPPNIPDTEVRLSKANSGAIEFVSVFRAIDCSGRLTSISSFQQQNGQYRIILHNQTTPPTTDTIKFSRDGGFTSFRRQ